MVLKLVFKRWDGEAWTGSSWLRIRTGWALVNAVIPFGFRKMRGISWLAKYLLASQERLLYIS
jgi:hypothetical protein